MARAMCQVMKEADFQIKESCGKFYKNILRDKKGVRHAGRPSNVFCNTSLSPQALFFSPLTSRQKVLCQVLSDHTDVVGGFISLLCFKLLCFSGRGSV